MLEFKTNIFGQDEFIDKLTCHSFIATAVVGSAVIGAGATIYGAGKAADAQTKAAQTAADTSLGMYNTTRGDLAPFRDIGTNAGNQLTSRLTELTSPITMDQKTLESTPGYQFNLTQGLKAVQNSAAARGLGVSGAAQKGAATFATGLADSTYQNQFNNANTNQSNAYNRLSDLLKTGENAAAQTGVMGTVAANTAASAQVGAGNAQAAAANATGGAISNASNGIGGYLAYKGLYGNSGGSGSGINLGGPGGPTPFS
jgi:hypothetical protein